MPDAGGIIYIKRHIKSEPCWRNGYSESLITRFRIITERGWYSNKIDPVIFENYAGIDICHSKKPNIRI